MRSNNRLPLELPDIFLMPLEKEDLRGDVTCMVAQMDHGDLSLYPPLHPPLLNSPELANIFIGKTNQHGWIEYGAALRHRDYKSCLVGAIAIYFFWRWQCSREFFPSDATAGVSRGTAATSSPRSVC